MHPQSVVLLTHPRLGPCIAAPSLFALIAPDRKDPQQYRRWLTAQRRKLAEGFDYTVEANDPIKLRTALRILCPAAFGYRTSETLKRAYFSLDNLTALLEVYRFTIDGRISFTNPQ